jgi:3D-(3,5/4)-trihydroxycyclohexane-1,2-dione acylhydrolase (decyclizing)
LVLLTGATSTSEQLGSIVELEAALIGAGKGDGPYLLVIDIALCHSTRDVGHWWGVLVPEVSVRAEVDDARAGNLKNLATRN